MIIIINFFYMLTRQSRENLNKELPSLWLVEIGLGLHLQSGLYNIYCSEIDNKGANRKNT